MPSITEVDNIKSLDDSGQTSILTKTGTGVGGDKVFTLDNVTLGSSAVFPSGHILGIAQLQQQETAGNSGGSAVATTFTASVLNDEVFDTGGFVTLNSNQFILLAGTYLISAKKACYRVGVFTIRLYDVTNTAYIDPAGTNAYNPSDSGATKNLFSTLNTKITCSGDTTYELRYYSAEARSGNGLGSAHGQTLEVYTEVMIYKIQP
jgi:hypothetical protein